MLQHHDEEARAISERASLFAREELAPHAVHRYMRRYMRAAAKAQVIKAVKPGSGRGKDNGKSGKGK